MNSFDFTPEKLRKRVLEMAFRGQTVHVPCAFSLIEILSALYQGPLRFNPKDPHDPERDFLILSKGHGVMALYACLRQIGWINQDELDRYCKDGSTLLGLAEIHTPGIEASTGSLGHGLPVSCGIALGLKRRGQMDRQVYCIVGDGELNEGSNWEALMFAAHHKLDHLTVIVDANQFQAMGETRKILDMEPLGEKFASFGFETVECDGHDLKKLGAALERRRGDNKPRAIIARTIKGRGISFMEGQNHWHYTRLDAATMEKCLKELGPNA